METVVGILIGLVIIGAIIYIFANRKRKQEETEGSEEVQNPDMANLIMRITELEDKGQVINKDFQVYIISEKEYNEVPEDIFKAWMLDKFENKTGEFSKYNVDGLGLQEFTYTVDGKTYDVFLLIVDETSERVITVYEPPIDIDPIEPTPVEPEPTVEIPTQEKPLVGRSRFDTFVELEWLPIENVDFYRIRGRNINSKSYITVGRNVPVEKNSRGNHIFQDYNLKAGRHATYQVNAVSSGEEKLVGYIEVKLGDLPEFDLDLKLPSYEQEYPANYTVYNIKIPEGATGDLTSIIQDQLDVIPNGTPDNYSVVRFLDTDRPLYTEGNLENNPRGYKGVIQLMGRSFMIIEGADDFVTMFTTTPAVPLGSSISLNQHSGRSHWKVRSCNNIWFRRLRVVGANSISGQDIGTTRELSPEWWYMPYDNGYADVAYLRANEEALIGGRELPEGMLPDTVEYAKWLTDAIDESLNIERKYSTKVAYWWLEENEALLLEGRTIPVKVAELIEGKRALDVPEYYEWLKQGIKEGTNVPRIRDTGASKALDSPVYVPEWEFEHGIDIVNCANIRVSNCEFLSQFGDGVYLGYTRFSEVFDTLTDQTGRQGLGYSNGVFDFEIRGCKIFRGRRASLDLEPYNNEPMGRGEISYSEFEGHLAFGGSGDISDINFHHNKFTPAISMLGSSKQPRRRNWKFNDNTATRGFGSPVGCFKFFNVENLECERNFQAISETQARLAVHVVNGAGRISIKDNDFKYASRIYLERTDPNAILEIEGNVPQTEDGMIQMSDHILARQNIDPIQPQVRVEYAEIIQ